jgi:hypothetical protein
MLKSTSKQQKTIPKPTAFNTWKILKTTKRRTYSKNRNGTGGGK